MRKEMLVSLSSGCVWIALSATLSQVLDFAFPFLESENPQLR